MDVIIRKNRNEIIEEINSLMEKMNWNLQIKIENVEFQKSKKNYVLKIFNLPRNLEEKFHVKNIIIKYFDRSIPDSESRWRNELWWYSYFLKNPYDLKIKTAQLLYSHPFLLFLRYIPGKNLQNLLIEQNLNNYLIESLSRWFSYLHQQKLIFKDARLINFLSDNHNNLYIIDLEEISLNSEFLSNLGEILCSFITLTPGIFEGYLNPYAFSKMILFLQYYTNLNSNKNILPKEAVSSKIYEFSLFWINIFTQSLKKIATRRNLKLNQEYFTKMESLLTSCLIEYMRKNPFLKR